MHAGPNIYSVPGMLGRTVQSNKLQSPSYTLASRSKTASSLHKVYTDNINDNISEYDDDAVVVVFTQCCRVLDVFSDVCLLVCLFFQHDNCLTSKHRMMKLVHCTKISTEFECGGHSPTGCAPPENVALGYDVGQISAGCLMLQAFVRR